MAKRELKKFTADWIAKLKEDGVYSDAACQGLTLLKRGNSKVFQHRYMRNRKAVTLNLGSTKRVTLGDARAKVTASRAILDKGGDPKGATADETPAKASTFREDTNTYFNHMCGEWAPAHATVWMQSMVRHTFKQIGDRDTAMSPNVIADAIKPLWITKHETAIRVIGRIRSVIAHAMSRAYGAGDTKRFLYGNPADAALDLLPRGHEQAVEPHRSLPWLQAPELYARLCSLEDRRAWPLRFLLLCCTPRTNEVIRALWTEIDLSDGPFGHVFHVPKERMKGRRTVRKARDIPLSSATIELLELIRPEIADGFIFRASRAGKTVGGEFIPCKGHIQEDQMNILLKELGFNSTVHGLRATFRSWVSDHAQNIQDHDAAEIALAHAIGSKVHRSYDRADMLLQRRDLAERWAIHLGAYAQEMPLAA